MGDPKMQDSLPKLKIAKWGKEDALKEKEDLMR
jgi:hypothetical protein